MASENFRFAQQGEQKEGAQTRELVLEKKNGNNWEGLGLVTVDIEDEGEGLVVVTRTTINPLPKPGAHPTEPTTGRTSHTGHAAHPHHKHK